ncbi:hypothetical protein B0H13DRAFT_1986724, partial [Mycena leptocephala]
QTDLEEPTCVTVEKLMTLATDTAVQTDLEEPTCIGIEKLVMLAMDTAMQTDPEEPAPIAVKEQIVPKETSSPMVSSRATVDMASQTDPEEVRAASPKPDFKTLSASIRTKHARTAAATDSNTAPPSNSWGRMKRDSSGLLDELKNHLAWCKPHATSPPPPQTTVPSRSPTMPKFPALRTRRQINKENVQPEVVGELLQVFKRKASGPRAPLGVVNTNVGGTDQPALVGARKIRRIVVPPVAEGSVPSRDPRIQGELDRLRAQGKVGGGGGGVMGRMSQIKFFLLCLHICTKMTF